jgi:hypothetical protein
MLDNAGVMMGSVMKKEWRNGELETTLQSTLPRTVIQDFSAEVRLGEALPRAALRTVR